MPNNNYDLEITIRTRRTGDSPTPPPGAGLKWTELKSAIDLATDSFNKVREFAATAYEGLSEGARLNLAREQFDNLAGSIDTTSRSLLVNLREATKGLNSDAELIATATDIINLGLAKSEEGTVRLATAVTSLGLDFNQVTLTLANNSKARLDSLGLSVEGVTEKTRELERQGFDGDAFDEAVLISLEEKMTLLGDASETTAGQLQRLESDWANLVNALKQGAATALGPAVSALVEQVDIQEALKTALDSGTISTGEYYKAQARLSSPAFTNQQILDELGITIEGLSEAQTIAIERAEAQAIAMGLGAQAAEESRQEVINYSAALAAARGPNEELSDKIAQTSNLLNEEEAAFARARGELNQLIGSQGEATGAAVEHNQELGNLLSTVQAFEDRNVTVRFFVEGLGSLERAQQLIANASGFNANDQPDPFRTQGTERQTDITGEGIDAATAGTAGPAPTNNYITINESINASATATQLAQELGLK